MEPKNTVCLNELSDLNIPVPKENSKFSQDLIDRLQLDEHKEGGYFKETDRSPFVLKNPYNQDDETSKRNYSTLIFYYLSAKHPIGRFHTNKSRIIHILQRGSGIYVVVDPKNGNVEVFNVGFGDTDRMQWVVDGGNYKSSFTNDPEGLLISEVVVPGFDFEDHSFVSYEQLVEALGTQVADKLKRLV